MENRASHLLVGSLVLALLVALFAFAIWLARIDVNRDRTLYRVYFEGSVSGLGVGSLVSYRGIRVGSIKEIGVDKEDPTRVWAVLDIDSGTPIRVGDLASVEPQGVTGVSYIDIAGAQAGSPPLQAPTDDELPVIASRRSNFDELFEGAPDLIRGGTLLVRKANELLDEENQILVTGILQDIKSLTGSLAERRQDIASLIDTVERLSRDIEQGVRDLGTLAANLNDLSEETSETLGSIRNTSTSIDGFVNDDARKLAADLRVTLGSINRTAGQAEALLSENRAALEAFTADGLNEFSRLITETRMLIAAFSRVTQRLESEGARFFFGERQSEFKAR